MSLSALITICRSEVVALELELDELDSLVRMHRSEADTEAVEPLAADCKRRIERMGLEIEAIVLYLDKPIPTAEGEKKP